MPKESRCREKFPAPPLPQIREKRPRISGPRTILSKVYRWILSNFETAYLPFAKERKICLRTGSMTSLRNAPRSFRLEIHLPIPGFFKAVRYYYRYIRIRDRSHIKSRWTRERSTYRIRIAFAAECRIKLFYTRKSVPLESTRLIISDLIFRVTNLRLLQTIFHLCVRIQLTTAHHASSDGN